MKARIRKTGEMVEVTRNKYGDYVDENCVGYNPEELIFGYEEDVHWQDVGERAAIAALQGLLANSGLVYNNTEEEINIIKRAMRYADALVEQLKKGK